MAKELRERLKELLVQYVKEQKQEASRKRKILEIRDKFRRLKDAANRHATLERAAQEHANRENAEKVKARVASEQAKRDANGTDQSRAA
jgi:hypothetical protein